MSGYFGGGVYPYINRIHIAFRGEYVPPILGTLKCLVNKWPLKHPPLRTLGLPNVDASAHPQESAGPNHAATDATFRKKKKREESKKSPRGPTERTGFPSPKYLIALITYTVRSAGKVQLQLLMERIFGSCKNERTWKCLKDVYDRMIFTFYSWWY